MNLVPQIYFMKKSPSALIPRKYTPRSAGFDVYR